MRPSATSPGDLEPVLVETGARPHGGEGAWVPMLDEAFGPGYNQLNLTIDSLTGGRGNLGLLPSVERFGFPTFRTVRTTLPEPRVAVNECCLVCVN